MLHSVHVQVNKRTMFSALTASSAPQEETDAARWTVYEISTTLLKISVSQRALRQSAGLCTVPGAVFRLVLGSERCVCLGHEMLSRARMREVQWEMLCAERQQAPCGITVIWQARLPVLGLAICTALIAEAGAFCFLPSKSCLVLSVCLSICLPCRPFFLMKEQVWVAGFIQIVLGRILIKSSGRRRMEGKNKWRYSRCRHKKRKKENKNRENRGRKGLNQCRVSVGHTKKTEREGKDNKEIKKERKKGLRKKRGY